MSKILSWFLALCIVAVLSADAEAATSQHSGDLMPPHYLYKVLSVEDWKQSQQMTTVKLGADDKDFIHLATQEQLGRITEKYWRGVPEYVVLTIETDKLTGRLVLEANPGGTNKYYHLYDGTIPLSAVIKSETINKRQGT